MFQIHLVNKKMILAKRTKNCNAHTHLFLIWISCNLHCVAEQWCHSSHMSFVEIHHSSVLTLRSKFHHGEHLLSVFLAATPIVQGLCRLCAGKWALAIEQNKIKSVNQKIGHVERDNSDSQMNNSFLWENLNFPQQPVLKQEKTSNQIKINQFFQIIAKSLSQCLMFQRANHLK